MVESEMNILCLQTEITRTETDRHLQWADFL